MKKTKIYLILTALVALGFVCFLLFHPGKTPAQEEPVRIGIAWRADPDSEFYTNISRAIREAGGEPVILDQVKVSIFEYEGSTLSASYLDENDILKQEYADFVKAEPDAGFTGCNASGAVQGVHAVVFTGGEDIAPTLLRNPEPWHGIEEEKDYNATRDISEYLTMAYCLDQNIPILGICRGLQMLAVVSGGSLIQDIPVYYAQQGKTYNNEHRNVSVAGAYRDYAAHDVDVLTENSWLSKMAQGDVIHKAPSWHHQAVGALDFTELKVVGSTTIDGIAIPEAAQRIDKTFAVGIQFHPEAAIKKHLNHAKNASDYMSYAEALNYFTVLVQQARAIRDSEKR